jgi:hypothetical protein
MGGYETPGRTVHPPDGAKGASHSTPKTVFRHLLAVPSRMS